MCRLVSEGDLVGRATLWMVYNCSVVYGDEVRGRDGSCLFPLRGGQVGLFICQGGMDPLYSACPMV